jgi:spore germination protein YaaH
MNSYVLLSHLAMGSTFDTPPSTHAVHAAQRIGEETLIKAPKGLTAPASRVVSYGYLPDWIANPMMVDLDSLSHVAWFNVSLNGSGEVIDTGSWNAIAAELVEAAHAVGTKVHLCVALFDEPTQAAVLSDPTHRNRAVAQLAALVNDYGADGLNVDFEGMAWEQKDELVEFVIALKAAVDEVYLATPAIDWRGAYDYDRLATESDGLFIMAYDYHWGGGDPGPVGPLHGGGPWSDYAQDWTLEDYRYWGVPDDKIIMGMPLYGRFWPTANDTVPGTATGSGSATVMASALITAAEYPPRFDETTESPWVWTGHEQLWYDDLASTEVKLSWAIDQGIQGVGYWALGYTGNNPEFWQMIDRITLIEAGGYTDDTGAPDDDTGEIFDGDEPVAAYQTPDSSADSGTPSAAPSKGGCGCGVVERLSWSPLMLVAFLGLRRRA